MSRRLQHRRPGLLFALLALAAQVAFGIAATDANVGRSPDRQLAALLAEPGAFCRGPDGGGHQTPHHQGIDCLGCPYCAVIATAAVLRGGGPSLPIPRAGPIAVAVGAPETILVAPTPRLDARPRGPPILA